MSDSYLNLTRDISNSITKLKENIPETFYKVFIKCHLPH